MLSSHTSSHLHYLPLPVTLQTISAAAAAATISLPASHSTLSQVSQEKL